MCKFSDFPWVNGNKGDKIGKTANFFSLNG